jgi:hypothetical protein
MFPESQNQPTGRAQRDARDDLGQIEGLVLTADRMKTVDLPFLNVYPVKTLFFRMPDGTLADSCIPRKHTAYAFTGDEEGVHAVAS